MLAKTIHLIGTSHRYQVRQSDADPPCEVFRSLVLTAVRAHAVSLIAEEMSLEAVQERGAKASVCREVADELQLPHCYCDANRAERAVLGAEDEQAIWHRLSFAAHRGITHAEIDQLAAPLIRASHDKREYLWLQRLDREGRFPSLFVCGANHVDTFSALLERQGMRVNVLYRDWALDDAAG